MKVSIVLGTRPEIIKMVPKENSWGNPFGDGKAGRRIVKLSGSLIGPTYAEKKLGTC